MPKVAVVGAGIVGLAVARQLQHEGADVVVVEKEAAVATHQTGRNSGVVHAGIYYPPGSDKARLCRRGVELLQDYCKKRDLPYDACGKVIVATDETQVARLEGLAERARANGVPGIALLSSRELRAVEPFAVGVAALHSPATAITDFTAVSQSLADDITAAGGEVRLSAPVTAIEQHGPGKAGVGVRTPSGSLDADRVIVCAGVHGDRLAHRALGQREPRIVPFLGEYYRLVGAARRLVRGMIYPVPDPRYPFLGVHLTRRIDGEVLVGPNARLALGREAYDRRGANLADLLDAVSNPGLVRLVAANWRTGAAELVRAASRRAFAAQARQYVPSLSVDDLRRGPPGIRAQAIERDGSLVEDFRIDVDGPLVVVRNAPSPAATSALAIAEDVVGWLS